MIINSSVQLRDYQARDAEKIRESFRRGNKAPLYVAPCGSGKTVIFAYVCETAVKRGSKVRIDCHRVELVDQISKALTDRGIKHGFIAAGYRWEAGHSVYVTNVFSLARRLDLFKPDLIITDEAHHCADGNTWGNCLSAHPAALRLGFTATPVRASGEGLVKFYDDLIPGPTYEELTNAGYLTPLRVYAPPTINTDGLHSRGGDFIPSEVAQRTDRPSITGNAIAHYESHARGKRAVVFDISVEAANKRAESFREAGIPSECIDGQLAPEVRRDRIDSFREGDTRVLTSVDLVEEGFDLPAIEVGIDLCPTQSLRKFMQKAGRLLRPMEGKHEALYFDHAGNTLRHGFPTEQREWTLDGLDKKGKPAVLSPRVCQKCFAVSPPHSRRCRACGEEYPVEPRKVPQKEGKLEEITPEQVRRKIQQRNQGRAQTLDSLIELYHIRHPNGDRDKAIRWANHVIDARRAKGRG